MQNSPVADPGPGDREERDRDRRGDREDQAETPIASGRSTEEVSFSSLLPRSYAAAAAAGAPSSIYEGLLPASRFSPGVSSASLPRGGGHLWNNLWDVTEWGGWQGSGGSVGYGDSADPSPFTSLQQPAQFGEYRSALPSPAQQDPYPPLTPRGAPLDPLRGYGRLGEGVGGGTPGGGFAFGGYGAPASGGGGGTHGGGGVLSPSSAPLTGHGGAARPAPNTIALHFALPPALAEGGELASGGLEVMARSGFPDEGGDWVLKLEPVASFFAPGRLYAGSLQLGPSHVRASNLKLYVKVRASALAGAASAKAPQTRSRASADPRASRLFVDDPALAIHLTRALLLPRRWENHIFPRMSEYADGVQEGRGSFTDGFVLYALAITETASSFQEASVELAAILTAWENRSRMNDLIPPDRLDGLEVLRSLAGALEPGRHPNCGLWAGGGAEARAFLAAAGCVVAARAPTDAGPLTSSSEAAFALLKHLPSLAFQAYRSFPRWPTDGPAPLLAIACASGSQAPGAEHAWVCLLPELEAFKPEQIWRAIAAAQPKDAAGAEASFGRACALLGASGEACSLAAMLHLVEAAPEPRALVDMFESIASFADLEPTLHSSVVSAVGQRAKALLGVAEWATRVEHAIGAAEALRDRKPAGKAALAPFAAAILAAAEERCVEIASSRRTLGPEQALLLRRVLMEASCDGVGVMARLLKARQGERWPRFVAEDFFPPLLERELGRPDPRDRERAGDLRRLATEWLRELIYLGAGGAGRATAHVVCAALGSAITKVPSLLLPKEGSPTAAVVCAAMRHGVRDHLRPLPLNEVLASAASISRLQAPSVSDTYLAIARESLAAPEARLRTYDAARMAVDAVCGGSDVDMGTLRPALVAAIIELSDLPGVPSAEDAVERCGGFWLVFRRLKVG